MFDPLVDLVRDGPVGYLVVLALVAADAIVPVLPSETALVTGGLLSGRGDLTLPLVVLAGAAGAVIGDTVLMVAGRRAAGPVEHRLLRSESARRRFDHVRDALHGRPWMLAVADFVPGARTVAMFAAGTTRLPVRRFYAWVIPGALGWALTHAMLGVLGGELFRDSFWASLAAALVLAGLLAGVLELVDRRTSLLRPSRGAG